MMVRPSPARPIGMTVSQLEKLSSADRIVTMVQAVPELIISPPISGRFRPRRVVSAAATPAANTAPMLKGSVIAPAAMASNPRPTCT